VLVVDDSAADRRMVADALSDLGLPHELHEAAGGDQALALLRGSMPRPHLVFLDIRMPGMTGSELLEHVHADPVLRGLNVVVLTTTDSDIEKVKVWELGARHFLRKPFSAETLRALLEGSSPTAHGDDASVAW
jgi:CheY-like chemotaxis protein